MNNGTVAAAGKQTVSFDKLYVKTHKLFDMNALMAAATRLCYRNQFVRLLRIAPCLFSMKMNPWRGAVSIFTNSQDPELYQNQEEIEWDDCRFQACYDAQMPFVQYLLRGWGINGYVGDYSFDFL